MNSCVPYTYLIQGEPNVSSTQWRSYADIKHRRYFFDIVTNFGLYYVDLNECLLTPGSPILKLDTSKKTKLMGDATRDFEVSKGFTPMY